MSARLGSSSVLLLLRLWPFPTAAVAAVAEVVAVTAVAETAAAVAAVVETAAAVAAVERSRLLLRPWVAAAGSSAAVGLLGRGPSLSPGCWQGGSWTASAVSWRSPLGSSVEVAEELPDRRADGASSMLVARRVELAVGGASGTTAGCIRYSSRLTDMLVGSSKGNEASPGEEFAADREFGTIQETNEATLMIQIRILHAFIPNATKLSKTRGT